MTTAAAGMRNAARLLALDAAAVSTVRVLADRGIPSLLLKGPAVARRLYPDDPDSRPYVDVDLLVAPATFADAEATLSSLGYRSVVEGGREDDRLWHEHEWRVPGQAPLTIDLHRGFAGVGAPDAFWEQLWSSAEQLPLAGGTVAVPGSAAAALLLALHAAAPGGSTKPRRELEHAMNVIPEEDWRSAARLARACGSESAFAVGLRLTAAGAALARRLDLPVAASRTEWLKAHPRSATAYSLAKLAEVPRGRARIRYFRLRLLPSSGAMRVLDPLAQHGAAGLTLAYARRLGRHALKAPQAVFELRAATELARGAARPPRPLRAAASAFRRRDVAVLRACCWALRAHRLTRRQLRRGGFDRVALRAAPAGGAGAERAVDGVLRWTGATCLERAIVRQRYFAGQGDSRVLIIGVTAPSAGFKAHAWLEGETSSEHHDMVEILRRSPAMGPTPWHGRQSW